MSEAQRLKMTGGHFIWIWADTSSTAEFFQPNSVPNLDDKDQILNAKANYDPRLGEYAERKSKYDKLESPQERQYYQQHAGEKRSRNNTRYKSLNTNTNRFHHIIGLRKPGDEMNGDGGIPSILPDRSFFKGDKFPTDMAAGQVPLKDKRASQKSSKISDSRVHEAPPGNDYSSSIESGKSAGNLNIKNINSQEFNANYYDPYSPSREGEGDVDNNENAFGGDFDDSSHDETGYYDYDKINPFQSNADATSATITTTRRPMTDSSAPAKNTEQSRANNHKNLINSNRNNRNRSPEPIAAAPHSKLFDDNVELDLDSYSEAANDLKAKRADNFPSTFNVSSHVFFHHFKDFPVGLLAIRHMKMNVDRIFVRSVIRLFASTWSRVEDDEELRASGKAGGRKSDWQDNWSGNDYDYDEVSTGTRSKKQKNKSNVNVNSRHNNARGSRKYRRDAQGAEIVVDDEATNETSISNSVNSSSSKTSNSNSKLINNLTKSYSQHVSDLNSPRSDVGNQSNNDNMKNHNLTSNSNNQSASRSDHEVVQELSVVGKIEVQKRQNTWWSNNLRVRNQEKGKTARGTPQYKGGCFGVPSRADMKRSELFSR